VTVAAAVDEHVGGDATQSAARIGVESVVAVPGVGDVVRVYMMMSPEWVVVRRGSTRSL